MSSTVWMAPGAGHLLRHAQRAERHALVDLDVLADDGGFPDHHAGAVVDAEPLADGGAGVNVDAGAQVGVLGQDARQDRDPQPVQRVRHAVDVDGEEAGVGGDHLVDALRCRIAEVEAPRRRATAC